MIRSLSIQNFQSHKDSLLEFVPGVNIIVGESDSGKTAILRALRWVVWNRPSGDAFRSTWGGDTKVDLGTDESEVARIKGKANEYQLDGQSLKAFGSGVPDELSILRINEINFKQQLESPFLLSESPGAVAQHFNRIAHLEKIDTAVKNVQSNIRSLEQDYEAKKKQINELQEELKQYEDIETIESEIEVLEQMQSQLTNLQNSKNRLKKLASDVKSVESRIDENKGVLEAEQTVSDLLEKEEKTKDLQKRRKSLQNLIKNLKRVNSQINKNNEILTAENLITDLFEKIELRDETKQKREKLYSLVKNVKNTESNKQNKIDELSQLESEFHEIMPETCPLCGNKTNDYEQTD
jgi:DNA repair exonuclease SbcCD ATPase subunit